MARIVAGLACSHAPSIAHAYDHGMTSDAGWEPLFRAFETSQKWLASFRPDVLVVIYNDHIDQYFYDAWPTFSIGLADRYDIPDEGLGARPFPPVPGHKELSAHIANSLVAEGFDITASHRMSLDHGFLSPMPMLDEDWKVPVVPLTINVVLAPLPSPRRCWQMGEAIGRAIASFPPDLRVVVFGTGGLSHQLSGSNCGRVTADWDRKFMDLIETSPQELNSYSMADFARLGGEHSVEVVQWMAMRAALPANSQVERKFYYPFGMMGYGIMAFRVPES